MMKNSILVEVCSDPSNPNYLDQDFLKDIQKRSKTFGTLDCLSNLWKDND